MLIATLEYGTMAMGLLGGLAIFLFGMEQMTDALKNVAGSGMKNVLARLTTNRFKAVFAGGVTTAVIQSSSVTTVLTVGFVSAGMMSLQQSIGVIMGAEIGTTVTAQIIAFKITTYALAVVALGFVLQFFFKSEKVRQYGMMILGFGLIFFGMNLMKDAMGPLKSHEPFLDLMESMSAPLLAILVSALFTGLVQSSSATTAVVILLGGEGLISLETSIALVLGANIGTCVTALLASIGKPRVAVQTALIHVSFNVAGVLLWFGLIGYLADFVRTLSDNVPRQIANAHTAFNVGNTLIFISFTPLFARFVQWLVPRRPEIEVGRIQPKYLDDNLLPTPALALERVGLELERAGRRAIQIVKRAPHAVTAGTREELVGLARMDDDVDALHDAIVGYLGRLSRETRTDEQTRSVQDYLALTHYVENMADIVETNLVALGLERIESGVQISAATQDVLRPLIDKVTWAAEQALVASDTRDAELARLVIGAKSEVTRLAEIASGHLMRRLAADEPNRLSAYRIEAELVESLKRLYYVAKRIGKVVAGIDVVEQQEAV